MTQFLKLKVCMHALVTASCFLVSVKLKQIWISLFIAFLFSELICIGKGAFKKMRLKMFLRNSICDVVFQVTISQRNVESTLDDNLNLRPTKLKPAATRKGWKIFLQIPFPDVIFKVCLQVKRDVNVIS